ncbi:hypothetical protein FRD01_06715 [Microvenator marinus]|jgi:hypothetical protein|uniref:Uncharacterized protein n=1 Tax=Microvenator marinus TaxID=2600177 RepID=A0A5B8XPQ2_9DELT|nr:hypothetical protein [Microvenator marinus]QED26938.1 hypothetical protein FRD01_06715 [Microvenator marinus]
MQVVSRWKIEEKVVELLHEHGRARMRGKWEFRVDGEVKLYGTGTIRQAWEAIYLRRKLP